MDQHWQQPPEPPPGAEDLPLAGLLAELLATSNAGAEAAAGSDSEPPREPEALEWPVEAAALQAEAPGLLRALDEAEQCRQEDEGADISGILLARLLEESAAESAAADAAAPETLSAAAEVPAYAEEHPAPTFVAPLSVEPPEPEMLTPPPVHAAWADLGKESGGPGPSAVDAGEPEGAGMLAAAGPEASSDPEPEPWISSLPSAAGELPAGPAAQLADAAEEQAALVEFAAEPRAAEIPLEDEVPARAAGEETGAAVAAISPAEGGNFTDAAPGSPALAPIPECAAPAPDGAGWIPVEDAPAQAGVEDTGPLAGAVFPAADGEVSTETVSGSELAPELECTAAALPAEDRAEGVVPLEEPDLAQPGAESVAQMEEEEQRATAILPPPSPEFASLEASLPAFPAAAAPWPARSASEEPASDEDDFELVDAEQAERMLDRLIDAARSVIRSSLPAMQATSAGAEAPRAQQEPPALSAPPGAPVPEQPAPARRELAEEGRGDVSPIPPAAALMALGLPERLRTRLESIGDLDQLLKSRSALAPAPEQGPRLLVFRAGGEYYGLHMEHVREVERVGRVTAVPGAPAFVKGLVNLRGEILPLLDLGALLGHAAAPEAAGRLVVAQAAPDEPPVALLVEELNGLAPLREESVAPAPRPGISRGAIEHRGRRVTWLEPAPVFGAEALERAAQPAARS